MSTHLPDVIAIERVFANQNANTAMAPPRPAGSSPWLPPGAISMHFHTPAKSRRQSPATAMRTRPR